MAESGIILPGSSYTLRSFLNNNSNGDPREHEAAVLVDSSGNVIASANAAPSQSDRGIVTRQVPNIVTNTGTISATGSANGVVLALNGHSNTIIQITGTWTGTIVFEGTVNGTDWVPLQASHTSLGQQGTQTTTSGVYRFMSSGMSSVRVYATALSAGTPAINLRGDGTLNQVQVLGGMLNGHNLANPLGVRLSDGTAALIGQKAMSGSIPVALASDQGNVPVNIASPSVLPVSDNAGSLTVDSPQLPSALVSGRLSVDGSGVTQPVSDAGGSLTTDSAQLPAALVGGRLAVDVPSHPTFLEAPNGSDLQTHQPTGVSLPALNLYGADQPNTAGTISAAQPNRDTPVAGGTVTSGVISKANNVGITVSGTGTGGSILIFEMSDDNGTTWYPTNVQDETTNVSVMSYRTVSGENRAFSISFGGMTNFRVRCITFSQSCSVRIDPGTLAYEPVVASVISNPAGATQASFNAAALAYAGTTEAFSSMSGWRNFTSVGAAAANFTVPAGKTFRILGWTVSLRGVAATATSVTFNLRAVLTGTVATTSPIVASLGTTVPATANSFSTNSLQPSAVLELPAGSNFGVSNVAAVANAGSLVWITLYGIEY